MRLPSIPIVFSQLYIYNSQQYHNDKIMHNEHECGSYTNVEAILLNSSVAVRCMDVVIAQTSDNCIS